jgi:hypothetical protein
LIEYEILGDLFPGWDYTLSGGHLPALGIGLVLVLMSSMLLVAIAMTRI